MKDRVRWSLWMMAGLLAACSVPAGSPVDPPSDLPVELPAGLVVRSTEGVDHAPLTVAGDAVHVVLFTSHECPIANAYAPTLRSLRDEWAANARVRLFLVHVDPDLTVEAAAAHAQDYELPGTILLDPRHVLASACGATITPEAVVITARGIAYRGRIDDQWRKLGSRAPRASQRDLAMAVANVLQGQPVAQPFPKAVGCQLPEPGK